MQNYLVVWHGVEKHPPPPPPPQPESVTRTLTCLLSSIPIFFPLSYKPYGPTLRSWSRSPPNHPSPKPILAFSDPLTDKPRRKRAEMRKGRERCGGRRNPQKATSNYLFIRHKATEWEILGSIYFPDQTDWHKMRRDRSRLEISKGWERVPAQQLQLLFRAM